MNATDRFEAYVQRYLEENIKTLPTRNFYDPEDYKFMLFTLSEGWRVLKLDPHFFPNRFKSIETLIKLVDEFDNQLERPLQKNIQFHLGWKPIQNSAKIIAATFH